MVEVKLVGMNVPLDAMDGIFDFIYSGSASRDEAKKYMIDHLTPEIIAAAFLRTSRSPKGIDQLLKEAYDDIPKARASNVKIIYGMGHGAGADNTMFNFYVKGVSRLCVEKLEERRLAGYLEKSQRYVTLDGDYYRPEEFSPEDLEKYDKLVSLQNDFYFRNHEKMISYLKEKNAAKISSLSGKEKNEFIEKLEGIANEDARYSLGLGTLTQLGMSYSGRTLQHAIPKLKYGKLSEGRINSKLLLDEAVKYAPSIIQFSDAQLFREHNPGKELQEEEYIKGDADRDLLVRTLFEKYGDRLGLDHHLERHYKKPARILEDGDVKLVRSKSIDGNVRSSLLFSHSNRDAWDCHALNYLLLKNHESRGFVLEALKHLSAHDKVPRAFEVDGGLVFEIVLSSSAFAQLKRHRMATLLSQDYDPALGRTIPESVKMIGADKELEDIIDKSSQLYYELLPKHGKAAEYCLTNAHRRRVLFSMNLREAYEFSRLREDSHAQWDIRQIANSISRLIKIAAPDCSILLGGRDEFENIKDKLYSPESS